jgi:hypothetical protein
MKILLLLVALLPFSAFAQTKEETAEWIVSKANESYNYGASYAISEGDLTVKMSASDSRFERTIPISSIKTVSMVHTDDYMTFVLKCDDDCVYLVETDLNDKFKSDSYKGVLMIEMYRKVDASLGPRMQKALLHLVELHGGKATVTPYQPKKETF